MHQPPPPFSCQYTPNFPEFLLQMRSTIVMTTYQAGKVIFLSAKNANELVQLPRTFPKAMGIALSGNKMAVATKNEVVVLVNDPRLAPFYPRNPNTYDSFFMPRATYYTGQVDIHDLHYGKRGLWAVNTSFSCLALIDENFSFTPVWQPHFVTELASEDRCHLNGMAMRAGEPAFVTALGTGNHFQSWRENITQGGVLMEVQSNEIIAKGLSMPHSPRLYNGQILLLQSAAGNLVSIDPQSGKCTEICQLNTFVRGMSLVGDYAFIAYSRLRQNSSTFKHLDIAKFANKAGLTVVHLPSGSRVAELSYLSSVDEIYDVQILPNTLRPGVLNPYTDDHQAGLSIPSTTFWAQSSKEQ